MMVQKGGQVTKPIIVVKVPCKLLYVIQVKEFLIKCLTSWPYLISEFLVAYIIIVASDWPRTFFTPKVFLFSISLLFVREENIMKKLLEKLLYKLPFLLQHDTEYSASLHPAAATCQLTFTIDYSENGICHSNSWKDKASVPQLIHTYLFTMLHTISIVNLTLKLNFDKLTSTIFF